MPHRSRALMALLVLFALPAAAQDSVNVEVRIVDALGAPVPSRVHVLDALQHTYPPGLDSLLISHSAMGGFFYVDGGFVMRIPRGATQITAGRGFEWRPVRYTANFQTDQVVTLTLQHPFDLRAEGWYGGDTHTHTQHPPIEYQISPEEMHFVARCEDLAQTWVLDEEYQFTGGPHAVSTPDAGIYYTTEYRNDAMGHVSLLGLKEFIGDWCCVTPLPVYPMLSRLHLDWGPQWDEAMVVEHPDTGADFYDDDAWPGTGLARELPVQAALGTMSAMSIAGYSSAGEIDLDDWYRLLNCGLRIAPSAGTDNCVGNSHKKPAGGYRVYVKEEPGAQNDPARWVEALKAGRSFVSNYPLLPVFTVDGVPAGETLDLPGPSASVTVHFRLESVLAMQGARVIRNGEVAADVLIPPPGMTPVVMDTTVQIPITEGSWLAVEAYGQTNSAHAVNPLLFAHTGPVYVDLDGQPARRTADAGYFLDWLDTLRVFLDTRDHWQNDDQEEDAHAHLSSASAFYRGLFRVPPEPFALLTPALGDTVPDASTIHFDWADAQDPEPGDRLTYSLSLAPDSLFNGGWALHAGEQSELDVSLPLQTNRVYWWRVMATDRGGNSTLSAPARSWFFIPGAASVTAPDPLARMRLWPNPAAERVWLRLPPANGEKLRIELMDAAGRRVDGAFGPAGTDLYCWSGRDARGHEVPSGLYWVRVIRGEARPEVAPVIVVR